MRKAFAILVTVLIAAGVFVGGWFGAKQYYHNPATPPIAQNDVGVIDDQGNDLTQGMHQLPKGMTFLASGAKPTLKVTLTPDFLPDKSVDWALVWHNPEQVPDGYSPPTVWVAVTPTTEGGAEAQIECKDAFNYRMRVIAVSRSNPEVRAECVLDYAKNINDPGKVCMTYADGTEWLYSLGGSSTNSALPIKLGETPTASLKDYTYFDVGTVEFPFRPLMTLRHYNAFQSYCATHEIVLPELVEDISAGIDMTEGVYERWFGAENWADLHKKNLILNYIKTNSEPVFKVLFGFTNGYREFTGGMSLTWRVTTDLEVIAESAEFETGNVIL